jgi:hypothetical protein
VDELPSRARTRRGGSDREPELLPLTGPQVRPGRTDGELSPERAHAKQAGPAETTGPTVARERESPGSNNSNQPNNHGLAEPHFRPTLDKGAYSVTQRSAASTLLEPGTRSYSAICMVLSAGRPISHHATSCPHLTSAPVATCDGSSCGQTCRESRERRTEALGKANRLLIERSRPGHKRASQSRNGVAGTVTHPMPSHQRKPATGPPSAPRALPNSARTRDDAPAGERICYASRTVTARPDAVVSWEKRGRISCRTVAGRRSKMSR